MIAIELVDVEPIGMKRVFCFENRGPDYRTHTSGWRTLPEYPPPSPEAERLHELRMRHFVTLGELARAMGVAAPTTSGLERGRVRPADPSDWDRIYAVVIGLSEGA